MTVRILVGDVRERLRDLPDQSVQCVVTSPPYYGLRDYGVPGQIGLEPTLSDYITALVDVFREVRRVLRPDGVCFLNLGDSYASQGGPEPAQTKWQVDGASHTQNGGKSRKVGDGLKPKDLMMVPARVAIALQDDGWWLRSSIVWAKPNPMPESVQDRPTSAHESIFLLTKSARYYYDAEAVRRPLRDASVARLLQNLEDQIGSSRANGGAKTNGTMKAVQHPAGANLRNVWTIPTKGFAEAHFATFPPEIPRLCIKAGSRPGDTVLDPFGGSGTTGMVADELGRDCILIELNPDYASMGAKRIHGAAPLLTTVEVVP